MREETSFYVFHLHDWSPILCASCICGFLNTQRSVNTWKEDLTADTLMFYHTEEPASRWSAGRGLAERRVGRERRAEGSLPEGPDLRVDSAASFLPPHHTSRWLHWEPRPRRGRPCGVSGLYLGVEPSPAWPLPWIFWFTVEEHRTGWRWQRSKCPPYPVKWMKHI